MTSINLLDLFLWTFRRNEKDVVNLYNALSPVMQLATGGNMLNFGYWNAENTNPISAQENLCAVFAKMAELNSCKNIVDVGSGLSAPAIFWRNNFKNSSTFCVNINYDQLCHSSPQQKITFLNSSSALFESITKRSNSLAIALLDKFASFSAINLNFFISCTSELTDFFPKPSAATKGEKLNKLYIARPTIIYLKNMRLIALLYLFYILFPNASYVLYRPLISENILTFPLAVSDTTDSPVTRVINTFSDVLTTLFPFSSTNA